MDINAEREGIELLTVLKAALSTYRQIVEFCENMLKHYSELEVIQPRH
jgi:hypothetical protein